METWHSIKRARERVNLNETAARKLIQRAAEYGLTSDQLPKKEREYFERKETGANGEKFICKYFAKVVFIFSMEGNCVTLFQAPQFFLRKCNFDGKTEVKNPKRYFKNTFPRVTDYEYIG